MILLLLLVAGLASHAARAEQELHQPPVTAEVPWVGLDENGCPAWLMEYATWHKANRGKPDATYLMFGPCSATVRCTGLGDRIRTSMAMLRLAAVHKKVLLLSYDHPIPLDTFLQPQAIDWRYDTQLQAQLQNLTSVFDTGLALIENLAFNDLVIDGTNQTAFRAAKVVKSQAVRDFNLRVAGSTDEDVNLLGYANLGRCFFRFLFKPQDSLWARADAALKSVYGATPRPYVAWHWRTGGLVGEPQLGRTITTHVDGTSRLHQLLGALHCAHEMAFSQSLPTLRDQPLLLITDHNIIRKWVAAGELKSIVTLDNKAVHIKAKTATLDDITNIWIDIALLARADCLLMSYSGFSWVSLFMSNTSCHMELVDCLKGQRKRFRDPDTNKAIHV